MWSLKLFIARTTLFTTMFTAIIVDHDQVSSSFVVVPIYIPSVVYGLRLFIVVLQELH